MTKHIAVIATLDTKGAEAGYLSEFIRVNGAIPIVIDPGVMGIPAVRADVTRQEVAEAAGTTLDRLVDAAEGGADRASATRVMIEGVSFTLKRLHDAGKLDGIVALGGSTGTAIGTTVMRAMPVGMPKLMVSTFIGPEYVGSKDITIMQCPADILGLNILTKTVLQQAAGAIVGMASSSTQLERMKDRPVVGLTALGVTTPAAMMIKEKIEAKGYEVIVFHMKSEMLDELIEQEVIDAVIDLTPYELVKIFIKPGLPARKTRLDPAYRRGLPVIAAPGGVNMFVVPGTPDTIADFYKERKLHVHGPYVVLSQLRSDEAEEVGGILAGKLNSAQGPVAIAIPMRGFSSVDRDGHGFRSPDVDDAFVQGLERSIDPKVKVVYVNAHLNDPAFADGIVALFLESVRRA